MTNMNSNTNPTSKDRARADDAEVTREYVPFADRGHIHGVTFDGTLVWFARNDEVVGFDPGSERVAKRFPVPGANAGTAFDGKHLYQIAKTEIVVLDPADGRVVRRFLAPADGMASGMAWADGHLYIGQFHESRIHKVDARTGEVVKTLTSDRFVTGVSCVDDQLWHGASYDDKPSELRHVALDGTVVETLRVPVEGIAGIEATGKGAFWCGGEKGTLRLVRKKRARAS